MEWLNEPASWQRTGDVLTVSVDPGTDFWRETGYGYIRDSGHVYGEVLAGDLDVSVRIRCALEAQFDQVGVMVRADEQTWLKTGVEFFEGRPRLSTVLTLGRSSWMVTDLPDGADDMLLRVSRRGDAVEVRYQLGDGPAELAALVFMPPDAEVLAGVMAAAPEGPGFRVIFQELQISERDWSEPAEDWTGEPAWTGDQGGAEAWSGADGAPAGEPPPGWDAQEPAPAWEGSEEPAPAWDAGEKPAPAWDAGQEPAPTWDVGQEPDPAWDAGQEQSQQHGWAAGAISEDHPSWPAGDPAVPFPGEDDPDWPKKLGLEEDPGWGVDTAGQDAFGTAGSQAQPDGPGDAPGTDAASDGPGGDPKRDAPATDASADAPTGPGPAVPGQPAEGERAEGERAQGERPKGERADSDRQAWAPAPTLEDAVADWDRLAAGVGTGTARPAPAERWTAQTDADVANEWPGPPLRAARRAMIGRGLAAGDEPGPAPSAAGPSQSPAEPAPPEAGPDGEPPDGQADSGPAPDGPNEHARAKRRKAAAAQPPVDLPGPPDPADEWISLLTADPAEE